MLNAILGHIDRVYDLELDVDIHDYLLSDAVCGTLGHDPDRASVLVHDDGTGDIELGVYLAPESLDELSRVDLTRELRPESFQALVTAIEEVSHFAYLVFSASRGKRVTQLELELQGEVDKFVTSMLLLASEDDGFVPERLHQRLFDDFTLRSGLDASARNRYLEASGLASRYCSRVVPPELSRRHLAELLSELRSFYRLTQRGKIGRIRALAG